MKHLYCALALLIISNIALSQITKPGYQAPSTSNSKRVSGPKKFQGKSKIIVVVDADATLEVDYEKVWKFKKGDTWKSDISAGDHVVRLYNDDVEWTTTVETKSGQQKIVNTKLQPKITSYNLSAQREVDARLEAERKARMEREKNDRERELRKSSSYNESELSDLISMDEEEEEKSEVYTIVENMPEYPGGNAALGQFIGANMKYPAEAQANGITGVVYVQYVVDKNGQVSNVKVLRGAHPDLDAEAVRVVRLIKGYKPGTQRGKPVAVQFTIPLRFNLSD